MIVVGDKDMSKRAKVTILAYFSKILYNGPLKWQVASFFSLNFLIFCKLLLPGNIMHQFSTHSLTYIYMT